MRVLFFLSTMILATGCLENTVQVDKETLQKAKLQEQQKLYIKLKSGQ